MTAPAAEPDAVPVGDRVLAQVWLGGPRLELRSMTPPPLAPGEALVAVDLATVCGSDLHTVSGRRPGPHPGILGHETVGRVVAVADDPPLDIGGTSLEAGDRVVWSVTSSCGRCDRCASGRTAKCRSLLKTGHEPLDGPWPLSGGYATHVHLRAGTAAVRVPDHVPDPSAAMSSCALATVVACFDAAGRDAARGARVVVIGAGMLGLCAAALARASGAGSITVVEPDADRARAAHRFGADVVLPPGEDVGAADLCVELSGHPDGVSAAVDRLDVGGRAVLAGSVKPGPAVAVDPERVVRRHLHVIGVHNYEPHHLAHAVDALAGDLSSYDWPSLVAPPVPLADLAAALEPPTGGLLRRSVAP